MLSLISRYCYPERSGYIEEMNLGPLRVDRIDVIKAIAHFKNDYPQRWQRISDMFDLYSDERAVDYIHKQLLEGCCAGTVNALFDKIIRGKCQSIEEASHDLQPEDVFYAQMISNSRRVIYSFSLRYGVDQYYVEEEIEKLNFHRIHFNSSMHFFPDSPAICQQMLEQTIVKELQCDKTENIAGVVQLKGHVLGFQYGPQGYFLWDTPDIQHQNLYRFSNSDAFFKKLASLTEHYCTLVNFEMSYGVRPLNHINPLLPPLQNASEAKEEESAASADAECHAHDCLEAAASADV